MSLILEALRKSEAERRRGQVPDLHASPAAQVPVARDGPPAWLWMALALAGVLVLAVVVWLGRGLLPGAPATGPTRLVAVDAMEPVAEDRQTDAAPPEPPRPAPSTVALLRPEQTADATRQAEPAPLPTPQRQQPQAIAAPSAAAPAAPRQTAPVAPTAMAAAAPPTERDRVSPAATVQAEPSFRDSNVASAATTAKAAAPAPATVAAAPLAQMPPMRLSDLPVSQREQLPPLRMSMHLWAPTQRFAIIDGARVAEGDRVGDAVVEAITSDGVTLAWQGQRLHIPVR